MRPELPPLPEKMRGLPIDHRGYVVPYFVAWIDGKADHRAADPEKFRRCVLKGLCWLCGQPLGGYRAFCIGPMCVVNRTTSEPGQHRECADYAARACPFMTRPHMDRRAAGLPTDVVFAAGNGLRRNPGAAAVYITKEVTTSRIRQSFSVGDIDIRAGVLFHLGEPEEVLWYCEGRLATRAEVEYSVDTGFPELEKAAALQGPEAIADLSRLRDRYLPLLPAA